MGIPIYKIRRIYIRKSRFTVRLRVAIKQISDRISDDISPQMKILNTVIT